MVLQWMLRGEIAQMEMPGKHVGPSVWDNLNASVDWDTLQRQFTTVQTSASAPVSESSALPK